MDKKEIKAACGRKPLFNIGGKKKRYFDCVNQLQINKELAEKGQNIVTSTTPPTSSGSMMLWGMIIFFLLVLIILAVVVLRKKPAPVAVA